MVKDELDRSATFNPFSLSYPTRPLWPFLYLMR